MTDVPGFTTRRVLGRGGMATVLLATQESLGREVALKILAPSQDDTASERFLREARIAASLQHPHIVPIFDFGVHEGLAWLAMQYLPLGTVAPPPGERLDPRAALRIVRDIASALDHAHAHGVIHRDVKPDNILRSESGAMLSDFGIARLQHAESALTRDGTSVGTPHYMSPEQLRGERLDGRSDLYSLGVVLWQLLTGETPYTGTDGWAIGSQHIQSPVPRLPAALASVQPLVDTLMAKAPAERPHSGAEVVAWIDRWLADGAHATPRHAQAAQAPATTALPAPAHAAPVRVERRRRPSRRPWVLGAAGLFVLAAASWWWWWPRANTPGAHAASAAATPAAAPALAVLPFEDLSPGRDQSFLSEGMAEEVLNRLAQVPGLRVAGRASAEALKHRNATVADVGRELHVNRVLDGSVRRDGDRLRVVVRLTNVDDGFQAWSQSYDRRVTDVFAVQDEIAGAVVDTLKLKLLAAPRKHTPSVATYDLYLRGRQQMIRGRPESSRASLALLREAVQRDPEYAAAWALLAMAEAFTSLGGPERDAGMARAMAAAERAVALDPTLGDAYGSRGFLRRINREWDGALADLQKAVGLGPGDARNHLRYAQILATLRRPEEALDQTRIALELDPLLTPAWHQLGVLEFMQRDVPAARRAFERVRALDPGFMDDPTIDGELLLLEDRAAEAREAFAKVPDAYADQRELALAMADYSLGRKAAARAAVARLAATGKVEPFMLATAHAWLEQPDEAFKYLELARQHEIPAMLVALSPFLDPIRKDPRYDRLLASLGLPTGA